MTHSRLIVAVLFLSSFYAYFLYSYNTTSTMTSSDRDTTEDSPFTATQHFYCSLSFFNWRTYHGCCEQVLCSERNIIGTQICLVRNHMLRSGWSTILTRHEMPEIIAPPLPTTGCESMDGNAKSLCEIDFEKILIVAACVGTGLVVVPSLFFIAWTLWRWIRAVRPKKRTIIVGKGAKRKAARLTGRCLWGKSKEQILGSSPGREAYIDEENTLGATTKRAGARLEEKEVWYGGVRRIMPWGGSRNRDTAVSLCCKIAAREN